MIDYLIYFVYIFFAVLVLYGIRKDKIDILHKELYFNRLNSLRGLLALDIIIGHAAGHNMLPLMPFEKFSIVSVAAFFFLSGSGLANSYQKKSNYLWKLPAKILFLICASLLLYLQKIAVQLVTGMPLNYLPDENNYFIKLFFETTNWYIWELIILYIVFGLIYRFAGTRTARVALMFVVVFLIGLCFALSGSIVAWYYSILGFPCGVLFSECFDKFLNFIHRQIGQVIIIFLFISGLIGHIFLTNSIIGSYITRNLFCVSCIVIIILIVQYFHVNNRVIQAFTTLSLELYLYQSLYLDLTQSLSNNYLLRLGLVLGGTLIHAVLIHPINTKTKNICSKFTELIKGKTANE